MKTGMSSSCFTVPAQSPNTDKRLGITSSSTLSSVYRKPHLIAPPGGQHIEFLCIRIFHVRCY